MPASVRASGRHLIRPGSSSCWTLVRRSHARTLNSHAVPRSHPTDRARAAPQPARDPGRRGFRRLLGVRLLSQIGDGWFQAGLAGSVFFNPEQAASPLAIALGVRGAAAAVLAARPVRRRVPRPVEPAQRPSSSPTCSGPALVLPAAVSVWYGREDAVFVLSALGVVALNRFFLAGMSAALPHVVDEDRLVTANSFATTAGTVCYAIGLGSAGVAVPHHRHRLATRTPWSRAARPWRTALAAALTPVASGADALGPDDAAAPARLGAAARWSTPPAAWSPALRHLAQRPAAVVDARLQAGHRGLYGVLAIMTLLLYRNYYNAGDAGGVDHRSAAGRRRRPRSASLLAALVTPPADPPHRRLALGHRR